MKKVPTESNKQPRSDFNWPPTDEDLAPFSADAVPDVHERLRAYFNWPADGEEAASTAEVSPLAPEQTPSLEFRAEPAPSSDVVPSEPAAALTFESADLALAHLPDETVDTPAPVEDVLPYEASTALPDAAVEPGEIDVQAREHASGGWQIEIARLQALLEELTEKLEWRATGPTRNESRVKH